MLEGLIKRKKEIKKVSIRNVRNKQEKKNTHGVNKTIIIFCDIHAYGTQASSTVNSSHLRFLNNE